MNLCFVGDVWQDDRIIFPGDAEYKYVEQARGNAKNARVFVLKFQGSSERLFFWMQEPSADKDEVRLCAPLTCALPHAKLAFSGQRSSLSGQHSRGKDVLRNVICACHIGAREVMPVRCMHACVCVCVGVCVCVCVKMIHTCIHTAGEHAQDQRENLGR